LVVWIIKDNFATREGEDKGQRWRATLNGSQSEHCKGVGVKEHYPFIL